MDMETGMQRICEYTQILVMTHCFQSSNYKSSDDVTIYIQGPTLNLIKSTPIYK